MYLFKAHLLYKTSANSETHLIRALNCIDMSILLGESIIIDKTNILTEYAKILHANLPKQFDTINIPKFQVHTHKKFKLNCDIPRLENPDIQYFLEHNFLPQKPAILTGCIDEWPAMENWTNLNYLIRLAGHRLVPIEIGRNYTTTEWKQKVIPFKDFLIDQFAPENPNSSIKYLAQHNLFDQIIELKDDIRVPDFCALHQSKTENDQLNEEVDVKSWFGPKGTISPMHFDPKNNLFCQIIGEKKIILASPEHSAFLYPHENFLLSNTSQIDCENLDLDQFPDVKNCVFYELILGAGEMLYIPPKWWHYVHSLSNSFSVSFWWL